MNKNVKGKKFNSIAYFLLFGNMCVISCYCEYYKPNIVL